MDAADLVDNGKIRVIQDRIWARETLEKQERERAERENSKGFETAAGATGEMGSGSSRGVEKTTGGGASSRAETTRGTGQEEAEDYR